MIVKTKQKQEKSKDRFSEWVAEGMTAVMCRCPHLREPCSKQILFDTLSLYPVFTPLRPSLTLSWSPGLAQALHVKCILVLSRAESALVLGPCWAPTWLSPRGRDTVGGSCWEETSHFPSFTRFLYVLPSRGACSALSRLNCFCQSGTLEDNFGILRFWGWCTWIFLVLVLKSLTFSTWKWLERESHWRFAFDIWAAALGPKP